jgi:hypothetical protein
MVAGERESGVGSRVSEAFYDSRHPISDLLPSVNILTIVAIDPNMIEIRVTTVVGGCE